EITGRTESLFPRPLLTALVPKRPAFLRDSLVQKRQGKIRLVAARTDLLPVHIPRRLDHAFTRCRSIRVAFDRGGIEVDAPFRIEAFAVLRGKEYLVTLLLEIAHDPDRGELLHKRIFELLFRGSSTRDKGQGAQ